MKTLFFALIACNYLILVQRSDAALLPQSSVVATVNGTPIYRGELKAKAKEGESETQTLDRLVLFHLAVQEAKKEGLEKLPEVQARIDQVLYKSYLEKKMAKSGPPELTEGEIQKIYEKQPMIRLRHLVLKAKTEAQSKKAKETRETIDKELKKGASFKDLVLKYTQDNGVTYAGDLDFRGVENLPAFLYQPALKLKKGEVAGPFFEEKTWHYIELIDKKSFDSAPATYVEFLRGRERNGRTEAFLRTELERLRKSAVIHVAEGEKAK